jgi:hypothetical protein
MVQAMTALDNPPGERWLVKMTASGDRDWTFQTTLGQLYGWRSYEPTGGSGGGTPGLGLAVNAAGDAIQVGTSSIDTLSVIRTHADGTEAWRWVQPSTMLVPVADVIVGIARAAFDRSDNAYVAFWGMRDTAIWDMLTIWKFSPSGDACVLAQGGTTGNFQVGPVGIAIRNDRLYVATQRQVGSLNLL